MTEPMSAARLADMRARAEQESYAANVLADDVLDLLAELDRVTKERDDALAAARYPYAEDEIQL
jgi:hypothetical protein